MTTQPKHKRKLTPGWLWSAAIAISIVVASCTAAAPPSSTTGTPDSGSPPRSTTTLLAQGPAGQPRELTQVDCESAPEDLAIVCEAYELIQTHYVDEIPEEALAQAATRGLEDLDGADSSDPLVCVVVADEFRAACDVAAVEADSSIEAAEAMVDGIVAYALDAVSAYFDMDELGLLEEEQQGEIEGIGALVLAEDPTIEGDDKRCSVISETCRVSIVSTIDGTPAEAAGLRRGDVFIAVNGEDVLGWSIDRLAATVRGPAGTDVTLTMDRDGELLELTITRARVVIPVIESEVFGSTGYVRLRLFNGIAGDQFQFTVAGLLSEGVERLVVDLRDNPGGLLSTAIDVASVFLQEGEVVLTQSPAETLTYEVRGNAIVPEDMPVIFVVNKGSASASELVPGVLQETGRITLVGENTFGKNTVQQRFGLSNGGAIKLTIARWITPGGLDFGGVGVTPDIEITFDPDIEAEDLVAMVLSAS